MTLDVTRFLKMQGHRGFPGVRLDEQSNACGVRVGCMWGVDRVRIGGKRGA